MTDQQLIQELKRLFEYVYSEGHNFRLIEEIWKEVTLEADTDCGRIHDDD